MSLRPNPRILLDIATLVILMASLGLMWDARQLKMQPPGRPSLSDSTVGTISLLSRDSFATNLEPGSAGLALVYVFRSDCPVCERQKAVWSAVAVQADSLDIKVVGLTAELLNDELAAYFGAAPIELWHAEPRIVFEELRTDAVPTTVLIDAKRKVVFHRVGLMSEADSAALLTAVRSHSQARTLTSRP